MRDEAVDPELRVIEVERTCGAYPSQWEGTTDDGQQVYARYRHGTLTVGVGPDLDAAVDGSMGHTATGGRSLLCAEVTTAVGDDGTMSEAELAAATVGIVVWPFSAPDAEVPT